MWRPENNWYPSSGEVVPLGQSSLWSRLFPEAAVAGLDKRL